MEYSRKPGVGFFGIDDGERTGRFREGYCDAIRKNGVAPLVGAVVEAHFETISL